MQTKHRIEGLVRLACLGIIAGSATYMAERSHARVDLTSEGLSEITEGTREVIRNVSVDRPVIVTAYVSKEVPRQYVATRSRMLNVLREMQASAGPGLTVRIYEPEPFSEEAQQATDLYGITSRELFSAEGGRIRSMNTFMGVAFTSGPREEVIEFMDPGLSVEYELTHALQVVGEGTKRVVGVLRTDAKIMGDFDLGSRRQIPRWDVISELESQYEVRSLNAGAAVPEDVDVLVVPQLSSMKQEELAFLGSYLEAGRPALLAIDPMPLFDLRLAPAEPMLPAGGQGGMFGQQQQQPPGEKGDYFGLLRTIGVTLSSTACDEPRQATRCPLVVFDRENPNPRFESMPPHFVFAGSREGGNAFDGGDSTVDGLEQIVTLFGGDLVATPVEGKKIEFTPLIETGTRSGLDAFDSMVDRHPLFGVRGPIPPRRPGVDDAKTHVQAARVKGESLNVIILADLDMLSDEFFALRRRGGDMDGDGLIDQRFDNVTFLLNAIDSLAGDDRFIELRKRQPNFRRLDEVEALTKDARDERHEEIGKANDEAEKSLKEAQEALDKKVADIRARTDIDETTKETLAQAAQQAENRRFTLQKSQVERAKKRAIDKIETEHLRTVDEVQNGIRLTSILLPPLPALAVGLLLFWRRRQRESTTIPAARQRGAK
jgi:ABC-2 type transport system permease protein